MIKYQVTFGDQFSKEFVNYPTSQKEIIGKFVEKYQQIGIDFTNNSYEGKFSPSWSGNSMSQADYDYAYNNDLWHYHIGIPTYLESPLHTKYKVSDWVLHFQWKNKGNLIHLVDLYSHTTYSGAFYLPPKENLI